METCIHHSGMIEQMKSLFCKLEMVEKAIQKQIENQEKSIGLAKIEMDRRLESMNEFRQQLSQQAQTFISRTEVDLRFREVDVKFSPLLGNSEYKRGASRWTDHIITVLIGFAVVMAVWFITKGG